MSHEGIPIVFGGAGIGLPPRAFHDTQTLNELFDVLEAGGCKVIDTAQIYTTSEQLLGEAQAYKRFTIDTKHSGGFRDGSKKEAVLENAEASWKKLGTQHVDVFYLHAPDYGTPISETLQAVDQVHKQGHFQRFGLSNFHASDVQNVFDYCKENNLVLPTVYQGNYSPITRKQEELLFPTLRKLGMAFYAYSPLAGGFLTKSKEQMQNPKDNRFDPTTPAGKIYYHMYAAKESYLDILGEWGDIANAEGCNRAELAYRWVRYHSPLMKEKGDAIIVGASRLEQIKETMRAANAGPLKPETAKSIDDLWQKIKHEAPLDNFNDSRGT